MRMVCYCLLLISGLSFHLRSEAQPSEVLSDAEKAWAQLAFGTDGIAGVMVEPHTANMVFTTVSDSAGSFNSKADVSKTYTSIDVSSKDGAAVTAAGHGFLKTYAMTKAVPYSYGTVSESIGRTGEVVHVSPEFRTYHDDYSGQDVYALPFLIKGHVDVNIDATSDQFADFQVGFRVQQITYLGAYEAQQVGFRYEIARDPYTKQWTVFSNGVYGCTSCSWVQGGGKFRLNWFFDYEAPLGRDFVQSLYMYSAAGSGSTVDAGNTFMVDSIAAPAGSFSVDSGALTYSSLDNAWHYPTPPTLAPVPEPATPLLWIAGVIFGLAWRRKNKTSTPDGAA